MKRLAILLAIAMVEATAKKEFIVDTPFGSADRDDHTGLPTERIMFFDGHDCKNACVKNHSCKAGEEDQGVSASSLGWSPEYFLLGGCLPLPANVSSASIGLENAGGWEFLLMLGCLDEGEPKIGMFVLNATDAPLHMSAGTIENPKCNEIARLADSVRHRQEEASLSSELGPFSFLHHEPTKSTHQPTSTNSTHQPTSTNSTHQPTSTNSTHQPTSTNSIHQPTSTNSTPHSDLKKDEFYGSIVLFDGVGCKNKCVEDGSCKPGQEYHSLPRSQVNATWNEGIVGPCLPLPYEMSSVSIGVDHADGYGFLIGSCIVDGPPALSLKMFDAEVMKTVGAGGSLNLTVGTPGNPVCNNFSVAAWTNRTIPEAPEQSNIAQQSEPTKSTHRSEPTKHPSSKTLDGPSPLATLPNGTVHFGNPNDEQISASFIFFDGDDCKNKCAKDHSCKPGEEHRGLPGSYPNISVTDTSRCWTLPPGTRSMSLGVTDVNSWSLDGLNQTCEVLQRQGDNPDISYLPWTLKTGTAYDPVCNTVIESEGWKLGAITFSGPY